MKYILRNSLFVATISFIITACHQFPSKIEQSPNNEKTVHQAGPSTPLQQDHPSHLVQCNRDLESLHTVSPSTYLSYRGEYDRLMKSSAGFVTVKDDVSPEVAELARPRFQYALVSLCYRIKDALAQSLINQAGGR